MILLHAYALTAALTAGIVCYRNGLPEDLEDVCMLVGICVLSPVLLPTILTVEVRGFAERWNGARQ